MVKFNGRVGHLEDIESPWANSGGTLKTLEDVEAMANSGVGLEEAGSFTIEGRYGSQKNAEGKLKISEKTGQPVRVYYHNPLTGETGNNLSMPNEGFDVVEKQIPEMRSIAHAHHKKLVVNVAPVSADPATEILELVTRGMIAGADAVLVNGGCPNVETDDGGRHELLSRNPRSLEQSLVGLRPIVERFKPVFLRISPQETFDKARDIFKVIISSGVVSAVFTPNTWPGFVPLDEDGEPLLEVPGGAGGRSGPATADDSAEQTRWAVELLRGSGIDVVSSSGIVNARELKRRLDIGAVAGAGTTFYYESVNGWAEDTDRMLKDLASLA